MEQGSAQLKFNVFFTGPISVAACKACTPGYYCQGDGNSAETGPCDAGWYCSNASTRAQVTSVELVYKKDLI